MRRRLGVPVAIIVALAALLASVAGASTASAAYIHPTATSSFGTDGTPATSFGGIDHLAFNQTTRRLYALNMNPPSIYGFNATTPGTYTALGGFPFSVNGTGSVPDLAVANASGNLYFVSEASGLYGFSSSGSSLFGPISIFQDPCGVATDSAGNSWVGDYGERAVREINNSGAQVDQVDVSATGSPCHIAFDQSNNDLYVADYGGGVYRYSPAAGHYPTHTQIYGGSVSGLAVDGLTHTIFIASSGEVDAIDPSGTLLERFGTGGGTNYTGVAVDESTGVVYVADSATRHILEFPGVVVPDVATGGLTGNATVHGHVDPAGGGDVTDCHFQYGTGTNYGSVMPCTPTIPPNYSGPTDVSADLNGNVTGEVLYHYRVVASNANGTNVGADQTFTPHFVSGLLTDPATNVTRNAATLNGEFIGDGEDTHYYFEWGTDIGYGTKSAVPPGEDAGITSGTTPLTFTVPDGGLQPSTTYHYRVVATNVQGVSPGNDVTFTTPPAVTGLSTDPAMPIASDNADLNGSFTGEGIDTQYHFEYGSSTSYGTSTPTVDLTSPNGPTAVDPTNITGLQPLHTYHFRIVASNSFGTTFGPDQAFTTTSPPVIVTFSSSDVNGDSANLHAVINPEGYDTEYHFEYGHTMAYGSRVPDQDVLLPASQANEPVTTHLGGLDGGVYHFRVVAKSIKGTTVSTDQTFNFYPPVCPNAHLRQQTKSDTLPDCRAYELVSAPDAGNTIIYGANGPFSPSATSPSRLAYMGSWGAIDGVGSPINDESGDLYMATRGVGGWQTKYVGLPAGEALEVGSPPWTGTQYPNPWIGQLGTLTNPSMSRIVQWDEGHRISDYPYNSIEASNAPYVWDSTTGERVDRWPTNLGSVPNGENFIGKTSASADLSHFVFTSDIPFAPGGVAGDMYDNDTVNNTLSIVSRDSSNDPIQADPLQVSTNGSHILMATGGVATGIYGRTNGPGMLYMRVDDATTYDIAPGHAVNYVGMTPDGSKVYFTSNENLAADNSDTDTSVDLYMWSEATDSLTLVSKGNDPTTGTTDACGASWTSKCDIVPITFTPGYTDAVGGGGGSPYSDNTIAPENGDIYFLSPEQLHGNNGVNGDENLYDFRDGKLQFVAALDPNSKACVYNINRDPVCATTAVARLEISPDDSHMAFLTGSKVTTYDNAGYSEMYTYTPATETVKCVSCMPNGEPPTSDTDTSHNGRFMTDDGRTFFDTNNALVPQDTNRGDDVYEYVDGRPQLISSGTAPTVNVFGVSSIGSIPGLIGVSADGTDVYFETYDTLVGQDRNGNNVKIYDARTGGGFPFIAPPPGCAAADECHGVGSSAPADTPDGTIPNLGNAGNAQTSPKKLHKKARHRRALHKKKTQRKGHRHG